MFIIQVVKPNFPNQHWVVSRTSNARMFGGTIRLTQDRTQAKQFTRKRDADSHARMIKNRCEVYDHDRNEFGLLLTEVKEM